MVCLLYYIRNIGDLKAPGADGMSCLLYKKHWEIVGTDVTREVQNFLNGGNMPEMWNETVVVVIPKTPNTDRLKDLRPISLCNVIYKIGSKVLSNRLKIILPDIMAHNQSTFVPGQLVTDNVLIAYEMTRYMQNRRSGGEGCVALKLDMSKAHDRVEWGFLEQMMLKLGFCNRWVNLITKCISTVSYHIRVNG